MSGILSNAGVCLVQLAVSLHDRQKVFSDASARSVGKMNLLKMLGTIDLSRSTVGNHCKFGLVGNPLGA